MAAEAQPSTATLHRSRGAGRLGVYMHGVATGIVGALTLAFWFFWLDVARGQPLYTPTVLGNALFRGGSGLGNLEALPGSVPMTISFTLVHLVSFVIMGVAASLLIDMLDRGFNVALGFVLLFVVLQFGFFAFAMTFAAVALDALEWPVVILGNAIAAATMATYLWRRHPHRLRHPPA